MSTSSLFQLQTEPQRKLYQQLVNTLGHGPAALYYDAIRMLAEESPYICTTHLVAHLLREIESSLRRVLLPHDYLPSAEEERHKKQIEAIGDIYSLDDTIRTNWVALATGSKEDDNGFAAFAHRDALTIPRPLDDVCKQMMTRFEQVLIAVLDAFERQSLHVYRFLDELLMKSQPGKNDVSQLKNKIPANWATYSYFFSQLENPAWLRPLSQKNGFAILPEDMAEGHFHYSLWPQAIYLKKMAIKGQEVHEQVLGVLITVANTNNPYAQQAILEIAQLLPIHLSAQLIPFIDMWITKHGRHLLVSATLQQFIVHLVQGGQISSAIALFENLLLSMNTDVPYLERWDYERLLFDSLPTFIENSPRELLALLCKLLDQDIYQHYVRFRKLDTEDRAAYDRAKEANTITWLPTFKATEHMHVRGTQSLVLLAIALRTATEQTIKDGYLSLSDTLSLLETYTGKIFKRLTLYLLSQFASTDLALARSWLMTRTLFNDADLRREYSLLAQMTLPHFTEDEQATWFKWVEEGPDLGAYRQRYQSTYQVLPTSDGIQQYKSIWQRDWLGRVESASNKKWMTDFTYIETREGWLFLAGVLDAYSRKIVGWSMSEKHDAALVTAALQMALLQRQPGDGLVHHSDRGSAYASISYQMLLREQDIQVSMSKKGDCYDNAMIESFWATLKEECFEKRIFSSRNEAKTAIFEYIEVYYNRKRRHSSLGYLSPVHYEKQGEQEKNDLS